MPAYFVHALAMALGFGFMVAAGVLAMFLRRKRWWLKTHRALGILGALCMLAGLAGTLLMHGESESLIPELHGALGGFVLMLAMATPVLGWLPFVMQNNRAGLRMIHRISGRTVIVLALANLCLGLFMVL